MTITHAFIQEDGNGKMASEMRDVHDELLHRAVPVELFLTKHIKRRQLSITPSTLVIGYVDTLQFVFKILDIPTPPTNDYPRSIRSFLHRRVWACTVQQLIDQIYEGHPPVFAKPLDHKKRFTGRVFKSHEDLRYLENMSRLVPILCAEVVEWLTEYRVFIIKGETVGMRHYAGDVTLSIDERVVGEAIQCLEASRETTQAYAIDFGVLASGQTALVEWNDGFALGSYGLDKAIYTDLLITRWCELTGC